MSIPYTLIPPIQYPAQKSDVHAGYSPLSFGPDALWDINQMFSDAGVTPAVSTGSIQQINDQSGNGRHLIQTVALNKPIASSGIVPSGGLAAAFSGSGTFLKAVDWTGGVGTPSTSMVLTGRFASRTDGFYGALIASSVIPNNRIIVIEPSSAGSRVFLVGANNEAVHIFSNAFPTVPTDAVFVARWSADGLSNDIFWNGAKVATGPLATGQNQQGVILGGASDTSVNGIFTFYRAMEFARSLTDAEAIAISAGERAAWKF